MTSSAGARRLYAPVRFSTHPDTPKVRYDTRLGPNDFSLGLSGTGKVRSDHLLLQSVQALRR